MKVEEEAELAEDPGVATVEWGEGSSPHPDDVTGDSNVGGMLGCPR